MPPSNETMQRWYPSRDQLKDPSALERTLRQVLKQHYDLQDAHNTLLAKVNAPAEKPTGPPPGSGPTDTQLCGLYVAPVNPSTLADGAKLTWVAAQRQFVFK